MCKGVVISVSEATRNCRWPQYLIVFWVLLAAGKFLLPRELREVNEGKSLVFLLDYIYPEKWYLRICGYCLPINMCIYCLENFTYSSFLLLLLATSFFSTSSFHAQQHTLQDIHRQFRHHIQTKSAINWSHTYLVLFVTSFMFLNIHSICEVTVLLFFFMQENQFYTY